MRIRWVDFGYCRRCKKEIKDDDGSFSLIENISSEKLAKEGMEGERYFFCKKCYDYIYSEEFKNRMRNRRLRGVYYSDDTVEEFK